MIKPIVPRIQSQKLFCQRYWQKIIKQTAYHKENYNRPGLFDYSDYNRMVLGISPLKCESLGNLDLSFKLFEPSKEKCTMWRGVTNPSYLYPNNLEITNYFNKCKNVKPGEILYLKEFAYISNDYNYAKSFISGLANDFTHI